MARLSDLCVEKTQQTFGNILIKLLLLYSNAFIFIIWVPFLYSDGIQVGYRLNTIFIFTLILSIILYGINIHQVKVVESICHKIFVALNLDSLYLLFEQENPRVLITSLYYYNIKINLIFVTYFIAYWFDIPNWTDLTYQYSDYLFFINVIQLVILESIYISILKYNYLNEGLFPHFKIILEQMSFFSLLFAYSYLKIGHFQLILIIFFISLIKNLIIYSMTKNLKIELLKIYRLLGRNSDSYFLSDNCRFFTCKLTFYIQDLILLILLVANREYLEIYGYLVYTNKIIDFAIITSSLHLLISGVSYIFNTYIEKQLIITDLESLKLVSQFVCNKKNKCWKIHIKYIKKPIILDDTENEMLLKKELHTCNVEKCNFSYSIYKFIHLSKNHTKISKKQAQSIKNLEELLFCKCNDINLLNINDLDIEYLDKEYLEKVQNFPSSLAKLIVLKMYFEGKCFLPLTICLEKELNQNDRNQIIPIKYDMIKFYTFYFNLGRFQQFKPSFIYLDLILDL